MENTVPYYDYCVPYSAKQNIMREVLKELINLGYKTVAIQQVFDHTKKDGNKRGADIFPEPHDVNYLRREFKDQIKILQRLTIIYTDGAVSHAMTNSLNLKKYHIVAGQPQTDTALTHCLTTFNGDLVTLDPSIGAKLFLNRKAYQVAIKRLMYFEIKYSPVIVDSNIRKDTIRMAHNFCVRGKPKNVIFSSGATSAFEVRGPYDVANLAFIFGLSEDQGKNAIDKCCRELFVRAESRRIGKTVMFATSKGPIVFSDSSEGDDSGDDEDFDSSEGDEEVSRLQHSKDNEKIDDSSSESDKNEHKNKKIKLS